MILRSDSHMKHNNNYESTKLRLHKRCFARAMCSHSNTGHLIAEKLLKDMSNLMSWIFREESMKHSCYLCKSDHTCDYKSELWMRQVFKKCNQKLSHEVFAKCSGIFNKRITIRKSFYSLFLFHQRQRLFPRHIWFHKELLIMIQDMTCVVVWRTCSVSLASDWLSSSLREASSKSFLANYNKERETFSYLELYKKVRF